MSLFANSVGLPRLLMANLDDRIETVDNARAPWSDGALWANSRGVGNGLAQWLGDDAGNYSGSFQASAPRGNGPPGGESPYLAHNTLEYMLADTRITRLATNTTLGTATRLDTASKTLTISETAERVFESVRLVMTFRSEWAATNGVIGVRMGIKLGSGPTADYDRTPATQNTASRNIFDCWDVDVTEYFQANFGTGTTQTCVASIAVASTTAANVNGITFKLIVTYGFDPFGSATRTKCIRIPIQSSITSLTTAQQELGIDGVNPAASGQMPALDTFLPELSKTYIQYYLDLHGHDNNSGTALSATPILQIDALTAVNRATIDDTIEPFLHWRDQYDMTALGLGTNVTHIISMEGDATTTARMCFVGGFVIVIYTYDHPSTLANNQAIYEVMVPMTASDSDQGNLQQYDSLSAAVATTGIDGQRFVAVIDIQEPGTPQIVQSGVLCMTLVSSAGTTFGKKVGNQQAPRVWTPSSTMGPAPIIVRADTAWTLVRGINRLTMDCYSTGRATQDSAYAIINYVAGIRGDVQNGNHVINHVGHTYDNAVSAGPIDVSRDAWGNRPPVLGTPYKISAVMLDTWLRVSQSSALNPMAVEQRAGEWDMGFGTLYNNAASTGVAVTQSHRRTFGMTRMCNADHLHTGKLDVTKRRRTLFASTASAVFCSWSWWVSYHQHAFTVGGPITIDGRPAPDGGIVQIMAIGPTISDPNPGAAELVTTAVIAGGAGAFSATVPDNTRSYFALYQNNGVAIASSAGAPV